MKTWFAMALACAVMACGTTKQEKKAAKQQKTAKIELQNLFDDINFRTQEAARLISNETDDREIRRRMITWQLYTLSTTRRAMQLPDPRWAFLDLWTMLYQTKLFVEEGDGKGMLGAQEPIALRALDDMLKNMEGRAAGILTESQVEEVAEAARKWAADHPIEGDAMYRSARPSQSDRRGVFSAVMSIPAGILSFGGGVRDTAQSINEVAAAAERAVDSVDALPLVARWETELLLYSLEENETTQRLLGNADRVSESVARIGKTVETLPATIEATVARALEKVETTQAELRETLAEGRGVVAEARGAIADAGAVLDKVGENGEWVERASANVVEAGKAWTGALEQVNLLVAEDPEAAPAEPAPPFDIEEAARTAEWATKAAAEVRGTAVELRGILEGGGLDERLQQIDGVLDASTERIGGLVDRIAWRAALLIVFFFAVLLGYKAVASRIS